MTPHPSRPSHLALETYIRSSGFSAPRNGFQMFHGASDLAESQHGVFRPRRRRHRPESRRKQVESGLAHTSRFVIGARRLDARNARLTAEPDAGDLVRGIYRAMNQASRPDPTRPGRGLTLPAVSSSLISCGSGLVTAWPVSFPKEKPLCGRPQATMNRHNRMFACPQGSTRSSRSIRTGDLHFCFCFILQPVAAASFHSDYLFQVVFDLSLNS